MAELRFDVLKEFTVKGAGEPCKIYFNPSDAEFIMRILAMAEEAEARETAYKEKLEALEDPRAILDTAHAMNVELRQAIDSLFNAPVSEALCGDVSIYAYVDGLPLWLSFFGAVLDEVDGYTTAQHAKSSSRLAKMMDKYKNRRTRRK